MVPKPVRDRIWATYRPGQCDDKDPSREYLLAAKDAVIAVATREGLTPDTELYDRFLALSRYSPQSSVPSPQHENKSESNTPALTPTSPESA